MSTLAKIEAEAPLCYRLTEVAERIIQATSCQDIQSLLHLATLAAGAERSFFSSMTGEARDTRYAFVIDCDAYWWHSFRSAYPLHKHPWLVYASRHATPIQSAQLVSLRGASDRVDSVAAIHGFLSAILIPVHSGGVERRTSLLCLGHSEPAYFNESNFGRLRVGTRCVAVELHDWWARHEKRELAQRIQLSDTDVQFLQRHCAGLSSKQIAFELKISPESVNSRFQRIIARLGARNRRAAARMAMDAGLVTL